MTGISFCNLGVVALGKTNGLQLASPGNTSPGKNISVKNITVLCNPTTDHAILLENLQYLEFENIITYGGVSGLAVKALDFTGRNLTHYDASGAGLTIRESPYAKCKRGIVSNVRVDRYTSSSNSDSSVQLLNNEEGAGMRDIIIDNYMSNSSDTAVFINGQNNTSPAESLSINNIKALQSTSFALYVTGNIKNTSIKGLETYNCVGISNIEVSGAYAPTDTLISDINDNAGAQAASRPILNDGVRTTISGFKSNITGMNIYNPVIENPGTGTTLSGFTYTGAAITDTGSGNHTILEGEEIQGIPTGAATPGKCMALKKSNGLMTVNIVNAIVNAASTDIALPFNMRFKAGSTSDPAQIRQNYNIKLSWYVNATSPTIVNLNAIAYPLTESTFRVILSGDPSAISTGAVISAELSGLWK